MHKQHALIASFTIAYVFFGACASQMCTSSCTTRIKPGTESYDATGVGLHKVVDDAVSITRALKKGCKVILLAKVYHIQSNIWFRNNSCLIGQGMGRIPSEEDWDEPPKTKLIVPDGFHSKTQDEGVLHLNGVSNVVLANFSVSPQGCIGHSNEDIHNKLCRFAIKVKGGSKNVLLSHIHVDSATRDGVNVSDSSNVLFKSVRVFHAGRDGISVSRSSVTFELIFVSHPERHGLFITDASNVTLSDSAIVWYGRNAENGRSCGVFFAGDHRRKVLGTVKGITIWEAYRAGICASHASLVVIQTRIHDTSLATCFHTRELSSFIVSDNICSDQVIYSGQRPTSSSENAIKSHQDSMKNLLRLAKCTREIKYNSKISDYSTILNDALRAGCIVRLSSGEFPIKSNVKLSSGSYLVGNGTNETYLRPPKSEDCDVWHREYNENGYEVKTEKNEGVLHINGKTNIIIADLTINLFCCMLEGFCEYGVKVKGGSSNVSLMHIKVQSGGNNAVRIQDSEDIKLISLVANHMYDTCVTVINSTARILHSAVGMCGRHGFAVYQGGKLLLQNSSVLHFWFFLYANIGCGANFVGHKKYPIQAHIEGLTVWNAYKAGICAEYAQLNVVNSHLYEARDSKCLIIRVQQTNDYDRNELQV